MSIDRIQKDSSVVLKSNCIETYCGLHLAVCVRYCGKKLVQCGASPLHLIKVRLSLGRYHHSTVQTRADDDYYLSLEDLSSVAKWWRLNFDVIFFPTNTSTQCDLHVLLWITVGYEYVRERYGVREKRRHEWWVKSFFSFFHALNYCVKRPSFTPLWSFCVIIWHLLGSRLLNS